MSLMQIPRRVDYGLRAIIYLSTQDPEKCCSIAEIARQQNVPKKWLYARSHAGPDIVL
jgi:DNA-binding IscR family transcriptional regulator